MAARKKKAAKKRAPNPFGERLARAMALRGIESEADLVRRIHALVPSDQHIDLRNKSLTQQMVNHILQFKAKRSYFTPFLAAALDVPCLWLAFGIGKEPEKHRLGVSSWESDAQGLVPGVRRSGTA
jgi:hypothetical protein